MTKQTVVRLNVVFVVLLVAGAAQAAPVVVDGWSLITRAADYAGETRFTNGVAETTVQLPFSRTTTKTYQQSVAASIYSFEASESGATFDFQFEHTRGGHGPTSQYQGAGAYGWGYIDFHVTSPVTYSVSGQYSMSGGNGLLISVSLMGPGQVELFANDQQSLAEADESFVLGEMGGADYNHLAGTPIGSLDAAQGYSLVYHYYLEAEATDSGASAIGSLRLTLTPEPSSFLFTLAALAAVCSAGRGRKRC